MASTRKVHELLRDIEMQEFILPEFQRGYVWTPKQVKEYLTSLYRGYPTGSFLIWKTPQNQKSRGTAVETDNKYYKLILDGQQRLTSLYALFNGVPPAFYEGEKLYFNIYFNLDTDEFTYYMEKKMKGSLEWIPVTEFLKYGDVGKFIAAAPQEAKVYYSENLTKLIKLNEIRNYNYHLSEIAELDIEQVVDVFNLVNSSGTPLNKADLALAHICSYWPEARDIFKTAQEKFKHHHFDFGLDFLTTCISAKAVDSVLFDRSFYKAEKELIQKSWTEVEKALEYIINILKNDAYIDSTDNLKSTFALVPLVYYLSKNNGSFHSENEKKKFLYWMYMALMWGRYSGRTYQTLQADIVNLKNFNKVESLIDTMKRMRGGNLEVTPDDLAYEGTSSRFYPISYIVARSLGAIDWFNGLSLFSKNVGTSYKIHNHHIFPQSLLYDNGYISSDSFHKRRVNEIANLAFITQETNLKISNKDPLKYLQEIKMRYPKALEKQFMPSEDVWNLKRYEDFLTQRREIIAKAINTYLNSLIKEGLETKPLSLEEIIALGENEMSEFKSSLRWDYMQNQLNKVMEHSCLKTIAAFLNYNSGTLYIGVKDDGEILGIEKDLATVPKNTTDGFELHLNQLVGNVIGKEYRKYIHISFETVSDKTICIVRVEASKSPAFMKFNGIKEFYIRSGNASQSLDMEEAMQYINSHWDL